jgi:hypothetical protein
MKAVAVGSIMPGLRAVIDGDAAAFSALIAFREGLYQCFGRRADALFELADAVLCTAGQVQSLPELSLEAVFRRGHGALYDALADGRIDTDRLAELLASAWRPSDDGPIKLAVDVTAWPRPDAWTSPQRCHCHAPCRCDGTRKTVAGWPFQKVAGLEWGASSWTALMDTQRLDPGADLSMAVVDQVGRVCTQMDPKVLAGRPATVAAFDSGYDPTRITYLARQAGLPVQVLARVRAKRVFYSSPPPAPARPTGGRTRLHGDRFVLADPATHPAPEQSVSAEHPRYGKVRIDAWHGLHQKLVRQNQWADHDGPLPIVAGTLIRVQADRLPGNRHPDPIWLFHTAPAGTDFDLDLLWKTYLRRFDLEHTFRLLKQQLGWTVPQVATPAQAERWTWLILAAYTQLRLARTLTNHRHKWQKPTPTGRPPTPGRVRRGFAHLRRYLGTPATAPKPSKPGPGRPKGTTRPPRTRYPVGKQQPTPVKTQVITT